MVTTELQIRSARIFTFTDYSLVEVAKALKKFRTYENTIDCLISTLDDKYIEKINDTIKDKGYPLKIADVSHPAVLYNYIYSASDIDKPFYFSNQKNHQIMLESVIDSFKNKTQIRLYQYCDVGVKDDIHKNLKNNHFKIIN